MSKWNMFLIGAVLMLFTIAIIPDGDAIDEQAILNALHSTVYIWAEYGWSGSGVIVDDGLILTAGHVIDDCNSFRVVFYDGRTADCNIAGRSYTVDLGFLDCNTAGYPAIEIASSDISLLDTVIIVGSPFGIDLFNTVTKGILSGKDRDTQGFFGTRDVYQTDAAAWPGNSGGPVLNADGQLIGILVGGYESYDSVSLFIPLDVCKAYIQEVEAYLVLGGNR